MHATNERLTILSEAEQSALYELPDFDQDQRLEYFTLTDTELALILSRPHLSARVYCTLQVGYFKAKQMCFRVAWEEIDPEDMTFILHQYFPDQSWEAMLITKHEYYTQCQAITALFGYRLWSKDFETDVRNQAAHIISRDINPQFVMMELLGFLQVKKIVRPRYTTLQIIVRDTLNTERNRLSRLIHEALQEEDKVVLQKLLVEEGILSGLAVLKQDAKDFKARMMITEREKLAMVKPLYQRVKTLLPQLKLSQQNIDYYASLIHYYSIHELRKRLAPSQTYLYLLCYIWLRYQQLNDNLVDAFCHHLKQFEEETKAAAKEMFYQHQKQAQNEQFLMRCFAKVFIDECVPDDIHFGEVRKQVFTTILPRDELRDKLSGADDNAIKEMDFRWKSISKLGYRFKNHLRPLAMALDFTSTLPHNPWLDAIAWFKRIFSKQQSLNQQPLNQCPAGTIPKLLQTYLMEINHDGKPVKLRAERYEFWIYRQLRKRLNAGELYLEDSIHHRSLNQAMVSLKDKEAILESLDIPALHQPIEKLLDAKLSELHELWIAFNDDLKSGKLKHLRYDEVTRTLHLKKCREDKEKELQDRFYAQLPLCDITDVLQFVNERCHFLSAFTHIQPRYAKQPADENSLIAVIIAQAFNHGNLNMAEICDIPYHILQDTYQSRVRLATLKAANDRISNDIAKMPIFPYYSLDLNILYGGVDGQKFDIEHPTLKARYSKKYFKKGKGVVAYTLLASHIPLQTELISPHEHESYFVFDIWYNNTAEVVPDVVTGDMHCINKGNFALMDWFGSQLFPRFTNIEVQRKHLYSGRDPAEYKNCLIQPVGQLDRKLIEEDWPNQQRIIATLALKEMKQSTLIKKLCTYTSGNPTRKALFEYDKLIRSIHTLKYLRDPDIQRKTHRSQNRVESYHQERATIAQVCGKKQLAGRTDIAIEVSNQCGRLIANAINHYNSSILSRLLDKYEKTGNKKGLALLKKISPVAWCHIHFQGHFRFSDQISINLDELIDKLILN